MQDQQPAESIVSDERREFLARAAKIGVAAPAAALLLAANAKKASAGPAYSAP